MSTPSVHEKKVAAALKKINVLQQKIDSAKNCDYAWFRIIDLFETWAEYEVHASYVDSISVDERDKIARRMQSNVGAGFAKECFLPERRSLQAKREASTVDPVVERAKRFELEGLRGTPKEHQGHIKNHLEAVRKQLSQADQMRGGEKVERLPVQNMNREELVAEARKRGMSTLSMDLQDLRRELAKVEVRTYETTCPLSAAQKILGAWANLTLAKVNAEAAGKRLPSGVRQEIEDVDRIAFDKLKDFRRECVYKGSGNMEYGDEAPGDDPTTKRARRLELDGSQKLGAGAWVALGVMGVVLAVGTFAMVRGA